MAYRSNIGECSELQCVFYRRFGWVERRLRFGSHCNDKHFISAYFKDVMSLLRPEKPLDPSWRKGPSSEANGQGRR